MNTPTDSDRIALLEAKVEMLLATFSPTSGPVRLEVLPGTPIEDAVQEGPGKIAHVSDKHEAFGICIVVAPATDGEQRLGRYLGCFYLDPGYHRIQPSMIPNMTKTQAKSTEGWDGDWSTVGIILCGAVDPLSASWPAQSHDAST